MIVLMDSTKAAAEDLSGQGVEVGQLLTPLTNYKRWSDTWAIDNGAFSSFDAAAFKRLLARQAGSKAGCLFVAAPDIVGNARRTLEVYGHVAHEWLAGWPRALVLQDGIEDLDIPWGKLDAVFVGGSTEFKGSTAAMDCAKAAKILGKHVHVGRVNTPWRADYWESIADTCDGSGLARYSHMREAYAEGLPLLAGGAEPLKPHSGPRTKLPAS